MLNCEYCNYIKNMDSKNGSEAKHICEFTGFVFHKNIEDYDMEFHPCYNYQYEQKPIEIEKISASYKHELKTA